MNRILRWGFYLVGGLLVIIAVLLASFSILGNYVLTSQLQKNGYSESSVGELDIRLLDSQILIADLQAYSANNLGLSFDRLLLDFSWRGVLDRQLHVESLAITKLQIRAQRRLDGTFDLGLSVPESAEAPAEASSPAQAWQVLLNELALEQTKLSLMDENAEPLVDLDFGLALQSLALDSSSRLTLALVELGQLALSVQQQPVLAFQQFTAEQLSLPLSDEIPESGGREGLVVEKLSLDGLTAALTLDAEGKPQMLALLATESDVEPDVAPQAPGTESGAERAPAMPWRLGGFGLSGSNNIRFLDTSVAPPVEVNLAISGLSVGALDSSRPEQATGVSLAASLAEYNSIKVSGTITPLQASPNIALKTSIEHLDISVFSPYVSELLGYKVKNGLLYLDSELKIESHQIQSTNALRLNKFNVIKDDEEKAEHISAQISMPLETALDLVRNKNDDIELELPIAGSLDSPEFSVGDIVNTTIAKALKGAAFSYLTYAIQPWGAVWMVGEKLAEQAQTISFDPVYFEPGQAVLDDQAREYLQTLASLLEDKPFLRLTLCPVSNDSDGVVLNSVDKSSEKLTEPEREALINTQLDTLGKKRAAGVKQFLVEQQAVVPDRLFGCTPHHDKAAKKPAVQIAM